MGLAVISIIIVAIVLLIAVPILVRVLGEATSRNPNRPGGEGDETSPDKDLDRESGAGRD
jgi:type II secretory pathway pseudopilin PulG